MSQVLVSSAANPGVGPLTALGTAAPVRVIDEPAEVLLIDVVDRAEAQHRGDAGALPVIGEEL